jgi:hypothetical protein
MCSNAIPALRRTSGTAASVKLPPFDGQGRWLGQATLAVALWVFEVDDVGEAEAWSAGSTTDASGGLALGPFAPVGLAPRRGARLAPSRHSRYHETLQENRAMAAGNLLSWKSENSILSIGSKGSILSIGSVGSIGSIGSIASFASAFSIGSFASVGSVMSAVSRGSVLSWRSSR